MNLTSVLILALVLLASVLAVRGSLDAEEGAAMAAAAFAARAGKIKPMMSKTTSVQYSLSHRKPPLSRNLGRGIFFDENKEIILW